MKIKNYIDRVYYIVFGAYFLLCLEMVLLILILKASPFYFAIGLVFLVVILLIGYFFYNRHYNLADDCIIIKVGFITKKIPFSSIEKCYITQNNRLSYATSMKRIGLTLKERKNDIYISPEQMDDILTILRKSTEPQKEKTKTIKKSSLNKPETKKAVNKASVKKTSEMEVKKPVKKTAKPEAKKVAKKTSTSKKAPARAAAKKTATKKTTKTSKEAK